MKVMCEKWKCVKSSSNETMANDNVCVNNNNILNKINEA